MAVNTNVLRSRNKREGKFINRWCLNPAYHFNKAGKMVQRKRAGGSFDLVAYRNVCEYGQTIPGITLVREPRFEGEE
jgi:hypothetical protein